MKHLPFHNYDDGNGTGSTHFSLAQIYIRQVFYYTVFQSNSFFFNGCPWPFHGTRCLRDLMDQRIRNVYVLRQLFSPLFSATFFDMSYVLHQYKYWNDETYLTVRWAGDLRLQCTYQGSIAFASLNITALAQWLYLSFDSIKFWNVIKISCYPTRTCAITFVRMVTVKSMLVDLLYAK
jgi:hypothetical protein